MSKVLEPLGLPEGKLRFWNLTDDHEFNRMEDLGQFDMPNGLCVDLGYYRTEYCVKVVLIQEESNYKYDVPTFIEIDLDRTYLEGGFTCDNPLEALEQFIQIAIHFSKVKIKNSL